MRATVVVVNKDDPDLDATLASLEKVASQSIETLVVDASEGRLDHVRRAHPEVRWVDYRPPPGAGVTIAHQRNVGARAATAEIIVFTDAGCVPALDWLEHLLAPIESGEETVTAGPAVSSNPSVYSGPRWSGTTRNVYVLEAPTINLAFRRSAFDDVGGFDESFAAGEDLDFTWRLHDAGHRIRWVPDAVVDHDWGDWRRQLRRSWFYGRGWARLYAKHLGSRPTILRRYPVPLVYALFLIGLAVGRRRRWYTLLLLFPAWRARHDDLPVLVVADHLLTGAGTLFEAARLGRAYWRA